MEYQVSSSLYGGREHSKKEFCAWLRPALKATFRTFRWKKHFTSVLIVFCFSTSLKSQPIDSLLLEIETLQSLRLKHIFDEKMDSIFRLFDKTIEKLFVHEDLCNIIPFDSTIFLRNPSKSDEGEFLAYSFMSNLVTCSSDNKVSLFSWDDLLGGSYHEYTNYLVQKTSDGKCKAIPFDRGEDVLQVGYYRIEVLNKGNWLFRSY